MNTQLDILTRMIHPARHALSPDAAKFFLSLDFTENDHGRMTELARKSNAGNITDAEARELDEYVKVGHLLAFLQSKSRLALQNHNSAA